MSVIESRMSDKHFIGGSKVSSSKKRGGHHNKGGAVDDDSIYDFVNLRYRVILSGFDVAVVAVMPVKKCPLHI